MVNVNASPGPDLIDSVVGLTPADGLYAIREGREKVRAATQGSYDLFFDPAVGNLTIQERLLVAYFACVLSKAHALGQHYYDALLQHKADPVSVQLISKNQLEQIQPERLKALLVFTQKLIEEPLDGDQAAVQALQAAGVSTPDIVTLAQLIAFLSYQLRLVAGLQAMKALESQI